MAWARERGVDVGIVRIFNTYGPRLREGDGRVVSNFVVQASTGRSLTVYGDGRQTRSLCYQSDLISGLVAMLDAQGVTGPVNLGNPAELTMLELASFVLDATGSSSEVVHLEALKDDPARRKPDITRAGELLGWAPEVTLADGLLSTISWFADRLDLETLLSRTHGAGGSPRDDDMRSRFPWVVPRLAKPVDPRLLAEDGSWSCGRPRHQPTCTANVLIRSPSVGRFERGR